MNKNLENNKLEDALKPLAVIVLNVCYRLAFMLMKDHGWKISSENITGVLEYAMLVAVAILVFFSGRKLFHKGIKMAGMAIIYIMVVMESHFVGEALVALTIAYIAEAVLTYRNPVTSDEKFISGYWKDWAAVITVSCALIARESMFALGYAAKVANPLAIMFLLITIVYDFFGDDKANMIVQTAFLLFALPALSGEYAVRLLLYWIAFNICLKITEWLEK